MSIFITSRHSGGAPDFFFFGYPTSDQTKKSAERGANKVCEANHEADRPGLDGFVAVAACGWLAVGSV